MHFERLAEEERWPEERVRLLAGVRFLAMAEAKRFIAEIPKRPRLPIVGHFIEDGWKIVWKDSAVEISPQEDEKSMKKKRTEAELATMVMHEVWKHAEWSDLLSVAIIRPVQSAPHHPNWDAAFTVDGPRVPPPGAFAIVRDLQSKFELV